MIVEIGVRENSVLDVKVSAFADVTATMKPVDVSLLSWFTSLKHKELIDTIREEPNEAKQMEMKKRLPLITPSGTFKPGRKKEGLINHSGLICLDIDKQDNLHLGNFGELGEILKGIPHAAYVGKSVRGKGYMVLFVLANAVLFDTYFRAITEQFFEFGIVIDSCSGNIAQSRFYSYDEDAQIRHQATPYNRLPKPLPPPPPKVKKARSGNYTSNGKRIPDGVIDELQNRVSVADIASHFSGSTTMKPGAGGSLKMQCPCPDTREGSDRFTVWPADNTFFCHKCHQGKGIAGPFKLLEEFNGMEFREAAHFMAETFCADLLPHFSGSAQALPLPTPPATPAPPPHKQDEATPATAISAPADEPLQIQVDGSHNPPPALMPDKWSIDTNGRLCDAGGIPYKGWYTVEELEELAVEEIAFIYRWENIIKQVDEFVDVATKHYDSFTKVITQTISDNGLRHQLRQIANEDEQQLMYKITLCKAMIVEPELEQQVDTILCGTLSARNDTHTVLNLLDNVKINQNETNKAITLQRA